MNLRKFYEGLIAAGNIFQHPLLLILRLYWGCSFFHAGWGKFQNIDSVSNFFYSLGIPFSTFNAYLAAGAELLGGFLLIIGLASRLAAIPLIFTMFVALATAHSQVLKNIFKAPDEFTSLKPFIYMLICLIIFTFGPGMFSIDALLKKLFFKPSQKK